MNFKWPILCLLFSFVGASSVSAKDTGDELSRNQRQLLKCLDEVIESRRINENQFQTATLIARNYRQSTSELEDGENYDLCQQLKKDARRNKKLRKKEYYQKLGIWSQSLEYPLNFFFDQYARGNQLVCNMTNVEFRFAALIGFGFGVTGGKCTGSRFKIRFAFGSALSLTIGVGAMLVVHRDHQLVFKSEEDKHPFYSQRESWFFENAALGGGIVYYQNTDANHQFGKEDIRGGGVGLAYFISSGFGPKFSGIVIGRDFTLMNNYLKWPAPNPVVE